MSAPRRASTSTPSATKAMGLRRDIAEFECFDLCCVEERLVLSCFCVALFKACFRHRRSFSCSIRTLFGGMERGGLASQHNGSQSLGHPHHTARTQVDFVVDLSLQQHSNTFTSHSTSYNHHSLPSTTHHRQQAGISSNIHPIYTHGTHRRYHTQNEEQ